MFVVIQYLTAIAVAFSLGFFFYTQSVEEIPQKIGEQKPLPDSHAKEEEESLEAIAQIGQVNSNLILTVKDERAKLQELQSCLQKTKCPIAHNTNLPTKQAVYQAMAKRLDELNLSVRKNLTISADVAALAREYLKHESNQVSQAAIQLLSSQPPSQQNMAALLEDLMTQEDSRVVQKSIAMLASYIGSHFEVQMHQGVLRAIKSGSLSTSTVLSREIEPLLNDEFIDLYIGAVTELPAQSKIRRQLASQIKKYRRLNRGS